VPSGSTTANRRGYAAHHSLLGCLQAARNRVYSATNSQWISRDPSGYSDYCSLYECFKSSPARFKDPSGLWSLDPIGDIGISILQELMASSRLGGLQDPTDPEPPEVPLAMASSARGCKGKCKVLSPDCKVHYDNVETTGCWGMANEDDIEEKLNELGVGSACAPAGGEKCECKKKKKGWSVGIAITATIVVTIPVKSRINLPAGCYLSPDDDSKPATITVDCGSKLSEGECKSP
jgi:RHS repeat-associated protein